MCEKEPEKPWERRARLGLGQAKLHVEELFFALERLVDAGFCRENVMGDPIGLMNVKSELRQAVEQGRLALAKARGQLP